MPTKLYLSNQHLPSHKLILALSLLISAIFTGLVAYYSVFQISLTSYFIFTIIYSWLISICFFKKIPEFIKLLNVLFFLGFWFKASSHMIIGHDFNEPAGLNPFLYLNQSIVKASIFGLFLLIISYSSLFFSIDNIQTPAIRKSNRASYLFYFFILLTLILAAVNWRIGFLRVGLAPDTKIVFPFSLLLSWFLGLGSSFYIFYYAQNLNLKKILLITLAMFSVSLTLISRNSLALFFYPIVVYFIKNRNVKIKQVVYLSVFIVAFLLSLFFIQNTRKQYHTVIDNNDTKTQSVAESVYNHIDAFFSNLKSLSLNSKIDPYIIRHTQLLLLERWIGFEGLLVSSQNESDENFKIMLTENQKTNLNSIYQELANSKYPKPGQLLFYTFPGPAGAIFFAESWLYRVIAFCFLALLIISTCYVIEKFMYGLAKSAISWWAAGCLTQLSLFPIHNLLIYFSYLSFVIIWLLMENRIVKKYNC